MVNLVVSRIALSLLGVVDDLKSSHLLESPESDLVESYAVTHLAEEESIEAVVGGFEKMIHEIVSLLETNGTHITLFWFRRFQTSFRKPFRIRNAVWTVWQKPLGCHLPMREKLYRRYTLKSVAETIGELRMEQAKRLCWKTESSQSLKYRPGQVSAAIPISPRCSGRKTDDSQRISKSQSIREAIHEPSPECGAGAGSRGAEAGENRLCRPLFLFLCWHGQCLAPLSRFI